MVPYADYLYLNLVPYADCLYLNIVPCADDPLLVRIGAVGFK
jgi:hypothetical protein